MKSKKQNLIKKYYSLKTLVILLLSLPAFSIYGNIEVNNRSSVNINNDWNYIENNANNPNNLPENSGKQIDLPHTWNQFDAIDAVPGYRRDASWYMKQMNIEKNKEERVFLYFEGANITTDVYLNYKKVGSHVGGYLGFRMEITDYIIPSKENIIHVRVDNSYNPEVIPSQKSDFFIYGGITRDVWLEKRPSSFIANAAVTTPSVSKDKASTKVNLTLDNFSPSKNIEIQAELFESGSSRAVVSKKYKLSSEKSTEISLPELKNPKLWSPKNPYLYTLVLSIYKKGKLVDSIEETIGYRFYRFEPYGAFFLNGERLILRGTHRHEEHAGYGAAMPNELHRQDMEQIKGMGVNFVRLGHYPQDPEVYKACNELGIIIWDEIPWCRGGMGNENWQNNTKRLLKEQITQNYNHPCILFWSLGNEIYWLPDFEDGNNTERLNAYLSELHNLSHSLDPYRFTAIRKYYAGSDLVDVFSPSIWSGWYAGVYTNYETTIEKNQKLYPQFLHMEYGGSSHVGRHTENPITGSGMLNEDNWAEVSNQVNVKNIAKGGDWTENYMVDLFDWYLHITENKDDFAGNAQWAFKDFGTPLRPENAIPYMNQKGLVDRAGKPKDAYYVFKSYWSDDPFTYIESHTWTHRSGPENKSRKVCVFSNCEKVELFLNGKSIGKKTKDKTVFPAGGLEWDVLFKEGENTLYSEGFINGERIAMDTVELYYTYKQVGKPDHINIDVDTLNNGNYLIVATMHDAENNRVTDYEKRVYFVEDGNGEFYKNYGTPTRSEIIEMANGRASIEYKPASGKATIEVRNQDFKGSYLILSEK